MLRMVLVLALIMTGTLQAIDRSGAGAGDRVGAAAQQVAHDVATADSRQCCDERQASEDKRSICKPDCKAVITIGHLKPHKRAPDYGGPRQTSLASIGPPVDLRPPIS